MFAPAVLANAPLAAMRADAGAPQAHAAIMWADARAPAVLAGAPDAVMRADAGAFAVLAGGSSGGYAGRRWCP